MSELPSRVEFDNPYLAYRAMPHYHSNIKFGEIFSDKEFEAIARELVRRWNAFEGLLEASRKALADLEEWKKWSESLEFIDMSDAGHIEYPSLVIMEELVAAIAEAEKEG